MLIALLIASSLWCLVLAGRSSRRGTRGEGEHDPVPTPLRVARRIPVPGPLVAAAGGPVDVAVVTAAGLGDLDMRRELPRARCALALAGLSPAVLTPALPALLPVAVLGGVLGWLWPGMAVARRAARRRRHVGAQLPDVLDLLGVCVEAGMALDPALSTVARRLGGPLGDELARVLDDLALGAVRRDAYAALATRLGMHEVEAAVAALATADELGTPLSSVLRDQASSLRAATAQAARDRAARAAPKVQLVVAMVMVPAVLILVVTVMVLELTRQMGPVFGGMG